MAVGSSARRSKLGWKLVLYALCVSSWDVLRPTVNTCHAALRIPQDSVRDAASNNHTRSSVPRLMAAGPGRGGWEGFKHELSRAPLDFAILTIFTMQQPWLASPEAQMGMEYGLKGHSIYAMRHGYDHRLILAGPPNEPLNWNRVRVTLGLFQEHEGKLACQHDWVVWMESDQFITNYNITLDSILDRALSNHTEKFLPDFVADIDAGHNLNTGVTFVRCSPTAVKALYKLLEIKETHKDDDRVKGWDHNGAVIILYEMPEFRDHIALAPPKVFNSYAWVEEEEQVIACPNQTICDEGFWSPGDFLVHFAGAKQKMPWFLRAFPPATWIGYAAEFAAPLTRPGLRCRRQTKSWWSRLVS